MYRISNIKVSLKIDYISLDNVIQICCDQDIIHKIYNNFIVLKATYTYVIFKSKNIKNNHINVTQIKSFSDINKAVSEIYSFLQKPIQSEHVDNIIASVKFSNWCDLDTISTLYDTYNIKYNKEEYSTIIFLDGY